MLNGALLVDKPEGMTSFQVVKKIRRHFDIAKIGHSGTLDPFATGLLVILVGKATRLQDLFLKSDKSYQGVIKLGVVTDTDDITGEVVSRSEVLPSVADESLIVDRLKEEFLGEISQVPPVFSAIKVNGKRSYKLAREDKAQELKPRKVVIRELKLTYPKPGELSYFVHCSKGTYVRSLGRDIGEILGCGACVKTLRRTLSGPFKIEDARTLDELLEEPQSRLAELLMPMNELIGEMPRLTLTAADCELLRAGNQKPLSSVEGILDYREEYQGLIALCDESGKLCAFAEQAMQEAGSKTALALRFVI